MKVLISANRACDDGHNHLSEVGNLPAASLAILDGLTLGEGGAIQESKL